MHFHDLALSQETLNALDELGHDTPTPIQEKAIPVILRGQDVIGIAQTGTGKTGGFTLPMIDILSSGRAKARMPRSLILSPTRELAAQTAEAFDKYGKHHKLTKALLIGGEAMGEQEKKLSKGVDVLIATPGRLIDLFERGSILFHDVKVFVIDEADRMLDMGFIPDIEKIAALLPPMRQTLLFSATMPPEIKKLGEKFLMMPKEIKVAPPASPAALVDQRLIRLGKKDKRATLRQILETEKVKNAYLFCNRKRDVGILYRSLARHGFKAQELHGDMPQSNRMATLEAFKSGEVSYLVCSDVAARGLDVPSVSHVFNFDVPSHAEDYVHRIGRTGRAGQKGIAYTFATKEDDKYLAAIEKIIGKKIPETEITPTQEAPPKREPKSEAKSEAKKEDRPPKKAPPKEAPPRGRQRQEDIVGEMEQPDNAKGFGAFVPAFFK